MRFAINVPATDIAKVATYLGKLGILLEEIPAATTAPAPKAARKTSGLPKGERHFKCHGEGCTTPVWTGPSKGTEKARWARAGLLCETCHAAGTKTTAKAETLAAILAEVEAAEADALASSSEFADSFEFGDDDVLVPAGE